jgi:hypothetical protein
MVIYVYLYIYMRKCIYMYVYISHVYVCVYICTRICTYVCVYVCVCFSRMQHYTYSSMSKLREGQSSNLGSFQVVSTFTKSAAVRLRKQVRRNWCDTASRISGQSFAVLKLSGWSLTSLLHRSS